MRRGVIFISGSVLLALAPFVACSDKQGVASGGDALAPEADGADNSVAEETGTVDGPSDAGVRLCSVGADASSRALQITWGGVTPTGTSLTVADTVALSDCTVVVATVKTSESPASWAIYVEKKDTTPDSCKGPKGTRVLATGYSEPPKVRATRSVADPSLFVVAYSGWDEFADVRNSPPTFFKMVQVDWTTGDTLHAAIMATDGAAPATSGEPTDLSTDAQAVSPWGAKHEPTPCDVVLKGFIYDPAGGYTLFPGGHSGLGPGPFLATWYHFLAPEPQAPSEADEAYINN